MRNLREPHVQSQRVYAQIQITPAQTLGSHVFAYRNPLQVFCIPLKATRAPMQAFRTSIQSIRTPMQAFRAPMKALRSVGFNPPFILIKL